MDLKQEIMADSRNASFTAQGLEPIYMIAPTVKILILAKHRAQLLSKPGFCSMIKVVIDYASGWVSTGQPSMTLA